MIDISKFVLSDKNIEEANLIVLVGVKHSGKSTMAKVLSEYLNCEFDDTDTVIEKAYSKTVRQIYNQEGKEFFLQAEAEACKKIVDLAKNKKNKLVIATGGGICDNNDALAILKDFPKNYFVFLDTEESVVVQRIIEKSKIQGSYPPYIAKENPQNQEDVKRIFHSFYVERCQKYLKLADTVWKIN